MLTARRFTVFALIALAAASPLQAQEVGVKLGLSSSELREERGGLAPLTALNAGAFVAVPVTGVWSVLAEANLYRKGYDADGEIRNAQNLFVGTDPEVQADYVSALVAVRYRAAWGDDGLAFYALLGPRLDVRVADRALLSVDGDREEAELEAVFGPSPTESTVFGATAGVGVDLSGALAVPLLVELRLNVDATTAWSVTDLDPFDDVDYRFRTFDLRVGYSF